MSTSDASRISIAICTYNRAESLRLLLKQLVGVSQQAREEMKGTPEIIVVDNNCTDDTRKVALRFSEELSLRVVTEKRQGLAHARNCALANFSTEAVLFLDDDVNFSSSTLRVYSDALQTLPEYDYFAGPIEVDWQGKKPKWLGSERLVLLDGLFGNYRPAPEDTDFDEKLLGPYGANFMMRRTLVEQIGEFNTELGVVGDTPGRGEETEYFMRARGHGLQGRYLNRAVVGHRFQAERLNLRHLYRYGLAKGERETDAILAPSYLWQTLSFFLRGLWQLISGRRDRFYQCVINIGIIRGRVGLTAQTAKPRQE